MDVGLDSFIRNQALLEKCIMRGLINPNSKKTMFAKICVLLIICGSKVSASELFKDFFSPEISLCEQTCDNSYSQHTYPSHEHAVSCKRGCRFYSYADTPLDPFAFSTSKKDATVLKETKQECFDTCDEAYTEEGNLLACKAGCENEGNYRKTNQYQLPAMADAGGDGGIGDMWSVFNVNPMSIFESMLSGAEGGGGGGGGMIMGGRIPSGQSVSMSWSSFATEGKDGRTIVVESPPQVVITNYGPAIGPLQQPEQQLSAKERSDEELLATKQKERENTIYEGDSVSEASEPLLQIVAVAAYDDDYGKSDFITVDQQKHGVEVVAKEVGGGVGGGDGKQDAGAVSVDWLSCISYKSGLPRWLLLCTVMLSVLAMVYLCISTSVTASEVRVKGSGKKNKYTSLEDECGDKASLIAKEKSSLPEKDGIFYIVPIHDAGSVVSTKAFGSKA